MSVCVEWDEIFSEDLLLFLRNAANLKYVWNLLFRGSVRGEAEEALALPDFESLAIERKIDNLYLKPSWIKNTKCQKSWTH